MLQLEERVAADGANEWVEVVVVIRFFGGERGMRFHKSGIGSLKPEDTQSHEKETFSRVDTNGYPHAIAPADIGLVGNAKGYIVVTLPPVIEDRLAKAVYQFISPVGTVDQRAQIRGKGRLRKCFADDSYVFQ